ncbi:hypothetical protein [Streptomyces sp. NPDC093071]|uniref:hypothetical protein n=1 Tax=Streptomyces sp. NPDC093071 TaxID=3366022 RepID=UPI003814FDD9
MSTTEDGYGYGTEATSGTESMGVESAATGESWGTEQPFDVAGNITLHGSVSRTDEQRIENGKSTGSTTFDGDIGLTYPDSWDTPDPAPAPACSPEGQGGDRPGSSGDTHSSDDAGQGYPSVTETTVADVTDYGGGATFDV